MKINNDNEAIVYIKKIRTGDISSDEETNEVICLLENYLTNITEILLSAPENISDEEVLNMAKENAKPILL
jgi:hypothetical protein